jgi:hypothetical protein
MKAAHLRFEGNARRLDHQRGSAPRFRVERRFDVSWAVPETGNSRRKSSIEAKYGVNRNTIGAANLSFSELGHAVGRIERTRALPEILSHEYVQSAIMLSPNAFCLLFE